MQYIILHKPFSVLSQFTPNEPGQRTLSEFGLPQNVYAAGRLDADSEGLLLLTEDGPLIAKMLRPMTGHARTYWAQVEGEITDDAIKQLAAGVTIQGKRTLPATAYRVSPVIAERIPPIRFRKAIPTSWVAIELKEGRNRQVRRMTAAVGFPTLRLIRVAIGPIKLDGLEAGKWRTLSTVEIQSLTSPRNRR